MKRTAVVSFLLVVVLFASCATPEATPTPVPVSPTPSRTASFVEIADDVSARDSEAAEFAAAQAGQALPVGGQARTGEPGKARLDLQPDGTVVRLGPGTLFTLAELQDEGGGPYSRLWLEAGQLWIILTGGSLDVETDLGIASVRGSLMGVFRDPLYLLMTATCLEGDCRLSNDFGTTDLTSGQAADIVGTDQPPSAARPMSQQEYQQWLENNPEAAGQNVPNVVGVHPAAPTTPISPSSPWPPSPASFQVTYPDETDDTENCFSSSQSLPDPEADILSTTFYDSGGEFLIVDVLVDVYSDTIYDVYVTLYWKSPGSYADYMAKVSPDSITLSKKTSSGDAPIAAGETAITGRTADGKRVFRFVVANQSDAVSRFVISLFHKTPEPYICDHQSKTISSAP